MATTGHIPLSDDAALVATLVGTALPFSHSAEDEAERWLRALRLHGQVGATLQALGVGEAPLEAGGHGARPKPGATPPLGQEALERAVRAAEGHAAGRGTATAGTADLLCGVLDVYDELFDDALARRGTTRTEVLERLAEPAEDPERT